MSIGKGKISGEALIKILTTPLVEAALKEWAKQYPGSHVRAYREVVSAWARDWTVQVNEVRHVVVSMTERRDYGNMDAQATRLNEEASKLTKEVEGLLSRVGQQAVATLIQQQIRGMGKVTRTDVQVEDEGVTKSATRLRIKF